MRPRIVFDSRIPKLFGANAIVLWPFIFFAPGKAQASIMRHELTHWQQIRRYSVVGFYILYIIQYLQNRLKGMKHHEAYMQMPLEIEARKNEKKD